jgi:hypothetical protein
MPLLPDGVDQRSAIAGMVIRTLPHSDGTAKAGVVASFIAVMTAGTAAPVTTTEFCVNKSRGLAEVPLGGLYHARM